MLYPYQSSSQMRRSALGLGDSVLFAEVLLTFTCIHHNSSSLLVMDSEATGELEACGRKKMDATITAAAVAPPDNNNDPDLAKYITFAFTMVQLHLNRSRRAWFLAGMWLCRLKARLGHGLFTVELDRHAAEWETSPETLRRRMKFYRAVRKGLVRRYYGRATPAELRKRLAELDAAASRSDAADEKVAELEAVIKSTAEKALAAHKAHGGPAAATLKVEGLTTVQREFLAGAIKRLKAQLDPNEFNERLLEFFGAWAQELPPEDKPVGARGAAKRKRRERSWPGPHMPVEQRVAMLDTAKQARKPLIFASEEDVL